MDMNGSEKEGKSDFVELEQFKDYVCILDLEKLEKDMGLYLLLGSLTLTQEPQLDLERPQRCNCHVCHYGHVSLYPACSDGPFRLLACVDPSRTNRKDGEKKNLHTYARSLTRKIFPATDASIPPEFVSRRVSQPRHIVYIYSPLSQRAAILPPENVFSAVCVTCDVHDLTEPAVVKWNARQCMRGVRLGGGLEGDGTEWRVTSRTGLDAFSRRTIHRVNS
jgi:hypothetical protein